MMPDPVTPTLFHVPPALQAKALAKILERDDLPEQMRLRWPRVTLKGQEPETDEIWFESREERLAFAKGIRFGLFW